jgi:hypothetical protein
VMDAIAEFGVSQIDMPLTPEKIWRAIYGATKGVPVPGKSSIDSSTHG